MDLIKVCVFGIVGAIIASMLKEIKNEFSIYVVLASGIVILIFILNSMQDLILNFYYLLEKSGLDEKLYTGVFKIIGVGYITEYSSGICEDCGSKSIANRIELAGKITIFVMSFPIFQQLVETLLKIISVT